jgi:uncharacterized paraquat-inducible protein A
MLKWVCPRCAAEQVLEDTMAGQPVHCLECRELADARRLAPRSQFRCPFCGTTLPPVRHSRISAMGWAYLILLFPFSVFGRAPCESWHTCQSCRIRLG